MTRPKLLLAGAALAGGLLVPASAHAAVTITSKGPGKAPKVSGTPKTGYEAFTFKSTSAKESDYTIVRLKHGVTPAKAKAIAAKLTSPTSIQDKVGTFVTGASPMKGAPYTVDVRMTKGTYLLVDDTKAPRFEATWKVAKHGSSAKPKADGSITMHDFMIMPDGTLPAGDKVVKVTNEGPSPHFIALVPVKDQATGDQVAALLKAGKEKQAEGLVSGPPSELLALVSPGVTNWVHTDLAAGTYVLACFYGDKRSKGKEHVTLGMESVVTVQ